MLSGATHAAPAQTTPVTPILAVSGLEGVPVDLVSPADPSFNERVRTAIPRWADLAVQLKPLMTIVVNRRPETLVAYAIEFDITRRDDTYDRTLVQFKYPDAVAGRGNAAANPFARDFEVRSGEMRVIGTDFHIMPDEDNTWLASYVNVGRSRLENAARIAIRLDAAIFENGEFAGPDQSNLGAHFSAYLDAKQKLYEQITSRLCSGESVSAVFQVLSDEMRALMAQLQAGPSHPLDLESTYRFDAIGEARRARVQVGDSAVLETFEKGIRYRPFALRRINDDDLRKR